MDDYFCQIVDSESIFETHASFKLRDKKMKSHELKIQGLLLSLAESFGLGRKSK
jgi:hypothetical protein